MMKWPRAYCQPFLDPAIANHSKNASLMGSKLSDKEHEDIFSRGGGGELPIPIWTFPRAFSRPFLSLQVLDLNRKDLLPFLKQCYK
ncbi:hypothetical protein P7K49_023874, partial [Saguinus oedipus]